MSERLSVFPLRGYRQANEMISVLHRHHKPVAGCKFCIGIKDETGKVRGVAVAGHPNARMTDQDLTLEITRCCTDGVKNGCSMLYRACWRAASAMGFHRLITYTLPEEGGASLRGANFKLIGLRGGGKWSRASRPREDDHPTEQKYLWEISA